MLAFHKKHVHHSNGHRVGSAAGENGHEEGSEGHGDLHFLLLEVAKDPRKPLFYLSFEGFEQRYQLGSIIPAYSSPEHVPPPVSLHDLHKRPKRLLLRGNLRYEQTCNEAHALAIPNVMVIG